MTFYAILDFSGTLAVVDEKRTLQRCAQATGLGAEALMELMVRPDPTKFDQATMAICESIIADEIRQAVPIAGIEKAIVALKQRDYTVFISSNGLGWAIKQWLRDNNKLNRYVCLVYGREDGSKDKHFEYMARIDDVDEWLYIADSPKDFSPLVQWTGVKKVAVNARKGEAYPKNVRVFYEPLSAELVERITIGG
jgi:phosphoglycolate phosphatase-like HAD superfamily hydrolase